MDQTSFQTITLIWIGLGILVFPLTLLFTAPFGRHFNTLFGPSISNRLGWIVMESPAIWWFTIVFVHGVSNQNYIAWMLWGLWMIHYLNRGLIFPFRIRTKGKRIPLLVVAFAFVFQLVNGFLNGTDLGQFGARYEANWLAHPAFWIGLAGVLAGWLINFGSDEILLKLRKPHETEYQIPRGGLFEWVSCPNFFGEIILWCSWSIMCWNLAAFSFAIWTIANLLPRALAHHRWYRANFANYPENRKAVIPWLL